MRRIFAKPASKYGRMGDMESDDSEPEESRIPLPGEIPSEAISARPVGLLKSNCNYGPNWIGIGFAIGIGIVKKGEIDRNSDADADADADFGILPRLELLTVGELELTFGRKKR